MLVLQAGYRNIYVYIQYWKRHLMMESCPPYLGHPALASIPPQHPGKPLQIYNAESSDCELLWKRKASENHDLYVNDAGIQTLVHNNSTTLALLSPRLEFFASLFLRLLASKAHPVHQRQSPCLDACHLILLPSRQVGVVRGLHSCHPCF